MSARDQFIARLAETPNQELLDCLGRAIRQNSYGSHEDQISIVEAELHRRMSAYASDGPISTRIP